VYILAIVEGEGENEMMKKNGKKLVFMVLCVFILWASAAGRNREVSSGTFVVPAQESTVLEKAFYATGANLQEVSVNGWAKLAQGELTAAELRRVVEDSARAMGSPATELEYKTYTGVSHTTVQAFSKSDHQNMIITAQVLKPAGGRSTAEAYLSLNVEKNDTGTDVGALEKKLLRVVKEKGSSYTITTCLSGWVSGKLEEEKMRRLIRQGFQQVEARVEDGITSPHLVSYAGATDAIDRSVLVGKKNINLNIAMRHHSTEDRTYVTAASPIITCEY